MTIEELQALGLTSEQIAKVFEMHGKVLNPIKETLANKESEISTLTLNNSQLTETQKTIEEQLKGFEGVDVEGLKKEIETLQNSVTETKAKHNEELEALKKKNVVVQELAKLSVNDPRDFDHLLNLDLITVADGGIMGLKDQMDKIKLEKPYLFKSTSKDVGGEGETPPMGGETPPTGAKEGTLAWFEEQERLKKQ